jgi:hypothetical protein
MANIGAAMNGGSSKKEKDPYEFFPTPEGTTRAVLPILDSLGFPKDVWENACGEGHISKVLLAAGYRVKSTDLVKRGYGMEGVNFLSQTKALAPAIITNPPFSKADEFVSHAITILGIEYIAMLLPSGIYHAKGRVPMFEAHTPCLIMPCTWRIDVTGEGSPTMNVSWYIWTPYEHAAQGYALFRPLTTDEDKPGTYDAAK